MAATDNDMPININVAALLVIPVAVAAITAISALLSARTQPTERLKNLVEASKSLPDDVYAKYTLKRMILRELYYVDYSNSPRNRNYNRRLLAYAAAALVVGFFIRYSSAEQPYTLVWETSLMILYVVITVVLVVDVVMQSRTEHRLKQEYKIRFKMLDTLVATEVDLARVAKDGTQQDAGATEPVKTTLESNGSTGETDTPPRSRGLADAN